MQHWPKARKGNSVWKVGVRPVEIWKGGEVASLGSGEEVHQGGTVELDMGEEPFGKDEWKAGKSGSNTVVQGLDIAFNTGSMMRRRRGSEDDMWCKESKAIDQREEAMFSIDVNSAHFMTKGAIHADDINYAKEEVIRRFGLGNCDVKAAAEFINSSDDLGVATCRWDTEQLDIQEMTSATFVAGNEVEDGDGGLRDLEPVHWGH